jgi:hypothetical protein
MDYYDTDSFIEDWKKSCSSSDGCTMPPGTNFLISEKIRLLCYAHDFDYQYGSKYGMTREEADKYLREGIIAAGNPILATIMFSAVRVFGSIHYEYFRSFKEHEKKRYDPVTFDSNRWL